MGNYNDVMQRTEWFREARFGMFIHWGLYAIPARGKGEWIRSTERISNERYQKYFDNFDPVNYDPKEWARIAKKAGMKYAVLTAKHHDGFCLFDSQYTEYKSTNTKAGRDLIREYVEAFREAGIKVGLYYSLIDWYHDDFPHYGDRIHPERDNPEQTNENRNFPRYVEYMHNQIRELLTNYGKIDLMWFDFSYNDLTGEKWEATKLMKMVRELQPHMIIDNRLHTIRGNIDLDEMPVYAGDFISPEQFAPQKGLTDKHGRPIPWEMCTTTQAESWGYVADHDKFLSAREVIYTLVDCVSKDGNLLLNVGPTAKGEFPRQTVQLLSEVGEWMHENSESIYGCGSAGLPTPEFGRYTKKDGVIYAHVFDKSGYCLNMAGVAATDVKDAFYLDDMSEIKVAPFWNSEAATSDAVVTLGACLKNNLDTVIKIVKK